MTATTENLIAQDEHYDYRVAPAPEGNGYRCELRSRYPDGTTSAWESLLYGVQATEADARQRFAERSVDHLDHGDFTTIATDVRVAMAKELRRRADNAKHRALAKLAEDADREDIAAARAATNAGLRAGIAALQGHKATITVPVQQPGNKRGTVELAALVYGDLAVHKPLNWHEKRNRVYVVTHVPSGMLFPGTFALEGQAKAYVVALSGCDLAGIEKARKGSNRSHALRDAVLAAKAQAEGYYP